MSEGIVCICGGNAFDGLKPKQRRDYGLVKAAVLADGGFSAFDATSSAALARIFDFMGSDPTVEIVKDTAFPWVGVRAVIS